MHLLYQTSQFSSKTKQFPEESNFFVCHLKQEQECTMVIKTLQTVCFRWERHSQKTNTCCWYTCTCIFMHLWHQTSQFSSKTKQFPEESTEFLFAFLENGHFKQEQGRDNCKMMIGALQSRDSLYNLRVFHTDKNISFLFVFEKDLSLILVFSSIWNQVKTHVSGSPDFTLNLLIFFCILYFIKESKHDSIFTSKYSDKLQKLCDIYIFCHLHDQKPPRWECGDPRDPHRVWTACRWLQFMVAMLVGVLSFPSCFINLLILPGKGGHMNEEQGPNSKTMSIDNPNTTWVFHTDEHTHLNLC